MNPEQVPYIKGYYALRAQRRAELGKLQRQIGDRKPASRFILAFFLLVFGLVMSRMFLPIGGMVLLAGFAVLASGFKVLKARKQISAVMSEENAKWNIRDRAVESLGEKDFETLAKSLEANGSYESLSSWLARKDFDEAEINTLILAAAASGEERQKMQVSEDMKARAGAGMREHKKVALSPEERAFAADKAAFGEESDMSVFETRDEDDMPETSTDEGLHAKLLKEEEGAALPPKRRRKNEDPELDDIRRRVAEAQRRRRS